MKSTFTQINHNMKLISRKKNFPWEWIFGICTLWVGTFLVSQLVINLYLWWLRACMKKKRFFPFLPKLIRLLALSSPKNYSLSFKVYWFQNALIEVVVVPTVILKWIYIFKDVQGFSHKMVILKIFYHSDFTVWKKLGFFFHSYFTWNQFWRT